MVEGGREKKGTPYCTLSQALWDYAQQGAYGGGESKLPHRVLTGFYHRFPAMEK